MSDVSPIATQRDPRLDFFRGAALLIILYDHVLERLDSPVPVFLRLTPYHWGLACAAAVFVFVSGQAYGLVYGKLLDRVGFRSTLLRSWRRVGTLYIANFITLVALVALLHLFRYTELSAGPLAEKMERIEASAGLAKMFLALMSFDLVPDYFGILPIYMLFIAFAPFFLWALSRRPLLAIIASTGLYVAAQAGLFMALVPGMESRLYFNPIAWQILFMLGIAVRRIPFALPSRRWLVYAALFAIGCVAIGKAVIPGLVAYNFMPMPSWWSVPRSWAEVFRPELPFVRILYFVVFAYAISALLPVNAPLWQSRFCRAILCLGRHSLPVFCLGVILTWAANMLVAHWHAGWPGALVAIGLAIAFSLASAALIEQITSHVKARVIARTSPS